MTTVVICPNFFHRINNKLHHDGCWHEPGCKLQILSENFQINSSVPATLTKRLNAAHHRWQRSILGISRKDRVTNEEVRVRTGQRSMDDILSERRLCWLGHVIWIDHQRIPRQALHWEVPGFKRGPGRPRTNWGSTVNSQLVKDGNHLGGSRGGSSKQIRLALECGPMHPLGCGLNQGQGKISDHQWNLKTVSPECYRSWASPEISQHHRPMEKCTGCLKTAITQHCGSQTPNCCCSPRRWNRTQQQIINFSLQ